jgi:hypothetical protein
MKKNLKKFRMWYRATVSDYPYWRVIYPNGDKTYLLYYREARGLADVFNGKLIIDYSAKEI